MKTYVLLCFLSISILANSSNDREVIKQIDTINSSALSLYNNHQIVEAFNAFNNAKVLSDSIQDYYGNAVANYNLGNIYSLMENYISAEKNYKQTLKLLSKLDDNYLMASTYLNLAKIFNKNSDYTQAIPYFEKAIKHSLNTHNLNDFEKKQIKRVYFEASLSLCELYVQNNNLDEALMNLLKIKNDINSANIDSNAEGYFKYIYGSYYVRKALYNNANSKFREAILLLEDQKESKDLDFELLSKVYMALSVSLAKSGQSTEAYLTLLEQNAYKEQRLNEIKQRQDLISKSKFLIEDYKKNAELANTERLQQIEIANKVKKINIVIFITLLLLLVCIVIMYRNYNIKRNLSARLKLKNAELQTAKNEALKSSELKSKFISNVTHELRTPLYGVVGITSLLLANNSLKPSDSKYLKSLKYSGDYLLGLINEVLEFSKIESEKIELKKVTVELRPLIENIIGSFDYKIKETNNRIHLNFDNQIPKYIKCDNVRLSQVLINLIGNSIKFTSNGDININVKNLNTKDDNVDLRFEVQDNGSGIPKEKFKSIFENFSQLDDSNTSYQGTGLGLTITKKIIELFGSQIELESEFGSGSTFSFNVNFDIDKEGAEKEKSKEIKEKVRALNNYRILIAEDNKINQVVTKNLLEKGNYYCEIVENGIDAIEKVKDKVFDLVLMDINMPKMGGIEATNVIREFNPDIPVIALTAADIEDFNINQIYEGFNGLITKPFDNIEFFQTIETNIELSKKGSLSKKIS